MSTTAVECIRGEMSKTFCISCDLEICRHQLHFDPMLSRPYDHHLPDEWITLVKGDPQINKAWHFCSYLCLSEWISLEREKERKAEIEKKKPRRNLIFTLVQNRYQESKPDFDLSKLVTTRGNVLQSVFATQFCADEELELNIHNADTISDWDYTLYSANDDHIAWAERAKKDGLIDRYKVEEVPA